jgi:hypothetical protein
MLAIHDAVETAAKFAAAAGCGGGGSSDQPRGNVTVGLNRDEPLDFHSHRSLAVAPHPPRRVWSSTARLQTSRATSWTLLPAPARALPRMPPPKRMTRTMPPTGLKAPPAKEKKETSSSRPYPPGEV